MARRLHVVRRGTREPSTTVEEIQLAVDRASVSFSMVVRALYLQRPEFSGDGDGHASARCRTLYPQAVGTFMDAHDGIEESFYAENVPAAVVLTGSNELC